MNFSFATTPDIPKTTTASCADAILNTNGGNANIEINWEPNTIPLHWYDGNTELTVPVESQSCVYDGVITVPTAPTKKGYTFNGWNVDHTCGLGTVDTNINAKSRCVKELDGIRSCYLGANYNLTENGTYAVVFDYGTILGEALCSSTGGSDGVIGNPDVNTSGKHCWCRITGYERPEGGICSTVSSWMYETLGAVACNNDCALTCAYSLHVYKGRRVPLYNSLPR